MKFFYFLWNVQSNNTPKVPFIKLLRVVFVKAIPHKIPTTDHHHICILLCLAFWFHCLYFLVKLPLLLTSFSGKRFKWTCRFTLTIQPSLWKEKACSLSINTRHDLLSSTNSMKYEWITKKPFFQFFHGKYR